ALKHKSMLAAQVKISSQADPGYRILLLEKVSQFRDIAGVNRGNFRMREWNGWGRERVNGRRWDAPRYARGSLLWCWSRFRTALLNPTFGGGRRPRAKEGN